MLTKKRWISLCMTVILLLCCMPATPAQAGAFEDIRVEYPVCVPYGLYNKYIKLNGPIVKSGDSVLQNNVDYTYSYSFDPSDGVGTE